ncbi:uncharacterized protein K452DRAFT_308695 [Aplosporella prunicola CBS 121167]|uniref:F-box domain-containing protein n=1 Tax=Aplosporella prunicola CBS 121167 TaxID=1176127 RepID=A0A6A6BEA6_9PEZI|nr:uncharacterized protein K452DRAFT_308695 [Aplosporella prunicola CBS 121167]KAF2141604.1 hypothetical protein K452DRAFT_308695 [Aplosporella prunicola CBS 121167]
MPLERKRPAEETLVQPFASRIVLEQQKRGLNDLPNELLDEVLSYCHFKTRHSLLKVSKRFQRVAEPWAYREYNYYHHNWSKLVWTLLRRPDLAPHIRDVSLSGDASIWLVNEEYDNGYYFDPSPHAKNLDDFLRVASRMEIKHKDEFLQYFENGRPSAEILVLLYLLPSVKTLDVSPPWLNCSFRDLTDPSLAFCRDLFLDLRHVKLQDDMVYHTIDADFLRRFLVLPSVRRIECFRMTSFDHSVEETPWPAASSNVDDLALIDSVIDTVGIKSICNTCKALKSLTLEWGDATVGEMGPDIAVFLPALAFHRDTLEHLVINISESVFFQRHYGPSWIDDGIIFPSIGSLKTLHRLKTLSISGLLLTGLEQEWESNHVSIVDIFPASLEFLKINEGNNAGPLKLWLTEFAWTFDREVLPNLMQIEIDYSVFGYVWDGEPSEDKNERICPQFLDGLGPGFAANNVCLVFAEL